jgi:sugar phosphate isomerase/epimerase
VRIACSSYIAPGDGWAEKIENLAKAGFEGMEVRLVGDLGERLRLARELVQAATNSPINPCSLVAPTPDFLVRLTAETRERKLTDLTRTAELAAILKVPALMCAEFEPQPPLSPFEPPQPITPEQRDLLLDFFRRADEIAERAQVTFLVEALNRYESSIYHRVGDAAQYCRDAGTRRLGILADVFHMNIEEADPVEALLGIRDLLTHVQLADNNRLLPGQGSINFARFFAALAKIKYSGYMALECAVSRGDLEAVRRCAKFLYRVREEVLA